MDLLNQQSKKYPKKVAIQYNKTVMTYEQLNTTVQAIANTYYHDIKDTRIGIKVKNPLEAIICILAALRAGKTIYLLNHHYKTYTKELIKAYHLKSVLTTCIKNPLNSQKNINITSKSSIRLFTTGSTGQAKCVIHSIDTLLASADIINKSLHYTHHDIWNCQLPFYHVSGLAILWRTLLAGATIQLDPSKTPYTHISCVEKQLEFLIKNPPKHPLKCILIGGSPIKKKLLLSAIQQNLPIYQSYGLTETGSACAITPLSKDTLNLSGKPLPHIKLKIKHKYIFVKGKSRCLGFEYPNNTITNLNPNNYYNTQDYGCLTQDNQLKIFGRSSRMIIINGENIQLETIETMVKTLHNIKEFYMLAIKKNETLTLYGLVELENKQQNYKPFIKNAIKKHFSSLCIPEDIIEHSFKNALKLSYSDIKKTIQST